MPNNNREFIGLVVQYPPEDLCTYPEYKGKPYFSIMYRENGENIVGFGTYKPEVISRYLKEYFVKHAGGFEWVEVKTRPATPEELEEFPVIEDVFECPLPDDGESVLVTTGYGNVEIDTFLRDDYGCYFESNDTDIKAWAHLPQGFKPLEGR